MTYLYTGGLWKESVMVLLSILRTNNQKERDTPLSLILISGFISDPIMLRFARFF